MDKVFIVRHPFNRNKKVTVYRSPVDGMFWVEQDERVVIICDQIVLRDVELDGKHGMVHGYVSNNRELSVLHDRAGHDENGYFPYCAIKWDLLEGFTDDGKTVEHVDFLDMQLGSLLAIDTSGVQINVG